MLKRTSPVLLVLALLLAGCSGSNVHKANRAAKQIADDLHEFEATVETQCKAQSGHCTGMLSDEEAQRLAKVASDGAAANDKFVAQIKATPVSKANAQVVSGWLEELAANLQALNTQAVLVHNPQAQKELDVIFQSINAALGTLRALLQEVQFKPNPLIRPASQGSNPVNSLPIQSAALDAEAIALVLAAFGSLTKLIAQARADGSLTDEQLQDATLAEDEDTHNKAQDFIKSLGG